MLATRLNAVHFNADAVRENINRDLGFSPIDRIEQARRMGWLCDRVTATGNFAIADFICPTAETRAAFVQDGEAFLVWADRVRESRFADTNKLFVPPEHWDVRMTAKGSPEFWTEQVAEQVRPVFDGKRPTALFIGRYQPFHAGHKALIEKGLAQVGQACIAVRNTAGSDGSNPFDFEYVRSRIEHGLREYQGWFVVIPVPNITDVLYGRDVGYRIEQLELDKGMENVSATDIRKKLLGSLAPTSGSEDAGDE